MTAAQALAKIQALAAIHGFALTVFTLEDVAAAVAQATGRSRNDSVTLQIARRILAEDAIRLDMAKRGRETISELIGEHADNIYI